MQTMAVPLTPPQRALFQAIDDLEHEPKYRDNGGFVSPTWAAYRAYPYMNRHSAYASPILLRTTKAGLTERNRRGWYRLTELGRRSLEAYDA